MLSDETTPSDPVYPDGWPLVGQNSRNTGFNPNASPPTSSPTVAWRVSFDDGDVTAGYGLFPRPAVADGEVYLGGRELTAFDLRDGSASWRRNAEKPVLGAAVDDERIYCQSWADNTSAELAAFDVSSGEEVWRTGGSWEYLSPPVVRDETVVVSTWNSLVTVDEDGTERWSKTLGNNLTVVPTIAGDHVYQLDDSRRLGKYPLSGDLLGGSPDATWTADNRRSVSEAPAVSDGSVYVGEFISWYPDEDRNDARVVSFGTDGTERWSREVGAMAASPAVADGTVYALTGVHQEIVNQGGYVEMRRDGVVRAFDADDGTERWKLTYPDFGNWRIAPVVADGVCYVALRDDVSDDQKLVAVRDGTELWSRPLPAPAYHLAAVGDTLLASLADGNVLALR